MAHGVTDEHAGGQYYFDPANRLFWTWDTPALISRKFDQIVRRFRLGGVMAWSLGEDSYDWSHIKTMARELAKDGHAGGGAADTTDASQQQNSSDASIPAPAPAPEVAPALASAPVDLDPAPTPSKDPYNVVWVDGTPQGPAADLATLAYEPSTSIPSI
jgi:chitinase